MYHFNCGLTPAGPMNREVLILVALFMGASIAAMIRNVAFSLAGERFVARLRKNVSYCCNLCVSDLFCIAVWSHCEARDGVL